MSAVQGKVLDAKRIKGDGKLGIEGGRRGGDRGWRGGQRGQVESQLR